MAPKHAIIMPLYILLTFSERVQCFPMLPERVLDDDVAVFKTRDWTNAL